jgi:hypothetical protein
LPISPLAFWWHAHLAEILPEALSLKESAEGRLGIQRPARRTQDLMLNRRQP